MDSNLKIILAEFEAHKGEFVICGIDNKLRRFVGIADGQEEVYLKGKVDDKDYNDWIWLAKFRRGFCVCPIHKYYFF